MFWFGNLEIVYKVFINISSAKEDSFIFSILSIVSLTLVPSELTHISKVKLFSSGSNIPYTRFLLISKLLELMSISFDNLKLILILDSGWSKRSFFSSLVLFVLFKFSFFHISTLSSERRGVKKTNKIIVRKSFLFKFNNFIGDIFFNFLLRGWKIKFT